MTDAIPRLEGSKEKEKELRLSLPFNMTNRELLDYARLAVKTYSGGADIRESLRPDWCPLDVYEDAITLAFALDLSYRGYERRPSRQAVAWGPFNGYFMADDKDYSDRQLLAKALTHAAAYLGYLQKCWQEQGLFDLSEQSLLMLSAKAMGLDVTAAEYRSAGHWGLVLKDKGKSYEHLWNPSTSRRQLDSMIGKLELNSRFRQYEDRSCIEVTGRFNGRLALSCTKETKASVRNRAFLLGAAVYAQNESSS